MTIVFNTQTSEQLKPLVCPVCAGLSHNKFTVSGFEIVACKVCLHEFADLVPSRDHVLEQFSDAYFFGGGTSGYENYLSNAELVQQSAERYTKIVSQHCESPASQSISKVLDIGCAAGFVMKGFRAAGWSCTGIDPNQAMVAQSLASGFEAYALTLETVLEEPGLFDSAPGSFDLVSMIQVIAHLSDISRATGNLRHLLREEGYVLVETWDSASITARLLGNKWHEYSPPNVLHYFSKSSLDKMFSEAGFKYVAGGRPAKRINIGHARSLFDFKYGRSRLGSLMIRASEWIPDNAAIPYPAEDLIWRIYQKRSV